VLGYVIPWSGKWVPTCRKNSTILTVEVYSEGGGSMVSFLMVRGREGTKFLHYFLIFVLTVFFPVLCMAVLRLSCQIPNVTAPFQSLSLLISYCS